MGDIQVWKVVCDGLLVASLVYLCYRFARSSASSLSPNAALMEARLRALLKEADQTAYLLNDKLLKRQGKIEELLFELETVENRINRSVGGFDEAKADLDVRIQKAQRTLQGLADGVTRSLKERPAQPKFVAAESEPKPSEAALDSRAEAPSAEQSFANLMENTPVAPKEKPLPLVAQLEVEHIDPIFEPPSFDTPKTAKAASEPSEGRAEARWSNVNIYGEPIVDAAVAAGRARRRSQAETPAPKGLAAKIEKEGSHPYAAAAQREDGDTLQQVYDAAEKLLKSGKDLATVASMTRLPIEEVRMLSQMVAQEARIGGEAAVRGVDDRLGVLGTMRREIQTL
ncbi:MAG: hypothetical protein GX589_03170 [Deltaproteobacteria bacterium]|nr:hypothetical protein [Deltaproteobacteria bacterium]